MLEKIKIVKLIIERIYPANFLICFHYIKHLLHQRSV